MTNGQKPPAQGEESPRAGRQESRKKALVRTYDPMMEPHLYHFWREKFREHGLRGAGDYWYDGGEQPLTFEGARQLVAVRELPKAIGAQLDRMSEAFQRMARAMQPAIRRFSEACEEAGIRAHGPPP